jgi:hypothetical protein
MADEPVAYDFAEQFVLPILNGTKTQTIRRNRRAKVGDRIELYTGLGTANCRKLRDVLCTASHYCAVRKDGVTLGDVSKYPRNLDEFAQADGFLNYGEMVEWFKNKYGGREFVGWIVSWR